MLASVSQSSGWFQLLAVRELHQPTIGQCPTAIVGEVGKSLAKLGRISLRGTIPV
jgi:hypothetical protein